MAPGQRDAPRQQLTDAVDRPVGDHRQHVTKIAFRIDAVQSAAPNKSVQLCTTIASIVGAEEQIVLSPEAYRLQRILRQVFH